MVGKERALEVLERVLELSPGDQTEVVLNVTDSSLTRFSSNYIHQNVAESNAGLTVRVIFGQRIGSASTNALEDADIKRTVEAATAIARLQRENPHWKGLPEPQPLPTVEGYAEGTAAFDADARAAAVQSIVSRAAAAGFEAAGAVSTQVRELAIGNSLGVRAYTALTGAGANTVVMSATSSGFAHATARDATTIDYARIADRAVEKCSRGRESITVPPGEYEVILEPAAAATLIGYVARMGFSALAVQEGRSFLAGKLGQKLLGDNITIWDDALDPRGMPMPFDFEGMPKQRLTLVENGVATNVVYDSYTAAREPGRRSTGHAGPGRFGFGPVPMHVFVATGEADLEDMIASTKRGILVTRFHYTNPLHPLKVIVTGMTRDGTFLVENGAIKTAVKNLRFTDSMLRCLNHVELIGREWSLEGGGYMGAGMVPALKIGKFAFTGVTEF